MNKTEKNKKAVISIARKAITYFSKNRFSNLTFNITLHADKKDIALEILIFDIDFNNKSFWFRTSTQKKNVEYKTLIKAIEKDNFSQIEEWGF